MASQRLDTALKMLIFTYGHPKVTNRLAYLKPTKRVASAPARETDPETSHIAEKNEKDVGRFTISARKAKVLFWYANHNGTDQQAALAVLPVDAPPSHIDDARRRSSELREVGFIYDTGDRDYNDGSNDPSIVNGIGREGRTAIILLLATGCSRPRGRVIPWTARYRNGHES